MDSSWDNVLNDLFKEINERRKRAIEFAFSLKGEIDNLSALLKYDLLIFVESIDYIEGGEDGMNIGIFPRELYIFPVNAPRDSLYTTLLNFGEELAFDNYRESLDKGKKRIMEEFGFLDPNNIPEGFLEDLKEKLYRNYKDSPLGRGELFFFRKHKPVFIQIDAEEVDTRKVLPGDLLFRVAIEGKRGRTIYISADEIDKVDPIKLLEQLQIQIEQANQQRREDLSSSL